MDIGIGLKIVMSLRNESITSVADKSGLSRPTVTQIVNGGDYKFSNLVKIAFALDCEIGDIIRLSNENIGGNDATKTLSE